MNHVLRVLDAYRPLALALAAILALVAVVPGADLPQRFDAAQFDRADPAGGDGSGPAGDPGGSAADDAGPTTTTPPAPQSDPAPSFTASPDLATTPGSDADAVSTPAGPTPGDSVTSVDPVDDDPAEEDTVTIAASGWASTIGGTPLSEVADDVPDDTLPVGTRVTQPDKISFVRLAGSGLELALDEVEDGRRGDVSEPVVRACQITDASWEPRPDQPISDAPAYDTEICARAHLDEDGTWRVPLDGFDDPTDDRGLALIPVEDPPIDFQVTFASAAA